MLPTALGQVKLTARCWIPRTQRCPGRAGIGDSRLCANHPGVAIAAEIAGLLTPGKTWASEGWSIDPRLWIREPFLSSRADFEGRIVVFGHTPQRRGRPLIHRNKIGLDTAVEALKGYKEQGRIDADALMRYAQTCRVANVIRPYLEAVL